MTDYTMMCRQMEALGEGCSKPLPVLANAAALLWASLPDINWAGFYLRRNDMLILGPFQGKPACTEIRIGKGVCGTAAQREETVVVDNVHLFPGHIACDAASNSEIVVPFFRATGEPAGVLDIDSTSFSRFSGEDREGLELFTAGLREWIDWEDGLI